METLPPEVLEKIVWKLTPQDLARCSAVCHKWRKIFNEEWIWRRLCEPELVEPLRTVPCMATPVFEVLEGPLSVSDWKLSFMRETHFWKNWRREEIFFRYNFSGTLFWETQILDSNENIMKFKREHILQVDFFTDNEVVVWCSNHIEILNVGVKPAGVVAATDTSVVISVVDRCLVNGNNMLLIENVDSVKVFTIDTVKKSIKLKHIITLNNYPRFDTFSLAKDHLYFYFVHKLEYKLILHDLNTGALLKEESSPVSQNPLLHRGYFNGMVRCIEMVISRSSDFIAFSFHNYRDGSRKYYIYSVKDLKFLPNVVDGKSGKYCCATLNQSWLAIGCGLTLKVINLLSNEESILPCKCITIRECDDSFIILCEESEKRVLKRYNPSLKSLTDLCEMEGKSFKIINNAFIAIFDDDDLNYCSEIVWNPSGQDIEKLNIFAFSDHKINQTLTKMLIQDYHSDLHFVPSSEFYILYLW